MSVSMSMPVVLWMSVGDSEVMNRLGQIDMVIDLVPINEENREPGDAIEYEGRVENFDLPGALRQFADRIEQGTLEAPSEG